MITLAIAEKFVKSRLALLIGLVIAVVWLSIDLRSTKADLKASDRKLVVSDSIHRIDTYKKDSIIYDCQQQQKITADNATQAEKQRAEKYEKLYDQVMEIKAAAQRKNIIK